jgi:hypothetical protein
MRVLFSRTASETGGMNGADLRSLREAAVSHRGKQRRRCSGPGALVGHTACWARAKGAGNTEPTYQTLLSVVSREHGDVNHGVD